MERLTVAKARAVTKPGLYRADPTLYLHVSTGGAKSWIQRIAINGRRRDIGLGSFALVTLAEACDKAFENRRLVLAGGDPLADKRRTQAPTFREAAERTFEANRPRWRNAKHIASWMQLLAKRALPAIGDMRVDQITREDVLRILTPIWTRHPEVARKTRRRIRSVLAWAQAHGFVEHNAAGEGIDGALPTMPKQKRHYRALPYGELGAALETVESSRASLAAKLALRFVVLTACRSGEARGASWNEIDEDARLWVIPVNRMKGGAEHRQPLSDAAMAVLDEARVLDDGSGLIFPSPARRGRPLSDMSLTKVLRDTGLAERATVHGFRTCFRTWASEKTNADHAVMESSLARAVGSAVERAYASSDLLDRRRRLMDQWGRFVAGGTADVVKLHA